MIKLYTGKFAQQRIWICSIESTPSCGEFITNLHSKWGWRDGQWIKQLIPGKTADSTLQFTNKQLHSHRTLEWTTVALTLSIMTQADAQSERYRLNILITNQTLPGPSVERQYAHSSNPLTIN